MLGYGCLEQESEQLELYQACSTYFVFMLYMGLDETSMDARRPCYAQLSTSQAPLLFFRRNLRACMPCCRCFRFCPPGCTYNSQSNLVIRVYRSRSILWSMS